MVTVQDLLETVVQSSTGAGKILQIEVVLILLNLVLFVLYRPL